MSERKNPDEVGSEPDQKEEQERKSRRDFLRSLGRWSAIIIGGAALGGMTAPPDAAGWVNGGGGWVNARGGGGSAAWVNRAGGGGVGWVNRAGGWINGGGWVNRSGGGWINSRGGWINRR